MSHRLLQHLLPALALALGAACADRTPGAPVLEALRPAQARPGQPINVEIRGRGFAPDFLLSFDDPARSRLAADFTATLVGAGAPGGELQLAEVRYAGPTRLAARLEGGLPEGSYALRVVDPRGEVAELAGALEITPTPVAPVDELVLAFVGGEQTVPRGGCSTGLTVELRDGQGNPAAPAQPVALSLAVSPAGAATLHVDDACAAEEVSQLTVTAPSTSGVFRFKGLASGQVTLTASGPGLSPATAVHNVTEVAVPGSAPWAKAAVVPPVVPLGQAMTFAATASDDAEDAPSVLEARWDFEGDGLFDTPFSPAQVATHTYPAPGIHTAVVEVRDPSGRAARAAIAAVVAQPSELLVVTTAADESDPGATLAAPGGTGLSLREALSLAATLAGPNTVTFEGPMTIALQSALLFPQDTAALWVVGKPGVLVNAAAVPDVPAISARGVDTALLHLEVTGSPYVAVELASAGARLAYSHLFGNAGGAAATAAGALIGPGNLVEDNQYIGLGLTANATADGNRIARSGSAIFVDNSGDGSTIQRNVVYDNAGYGLYTGTQVRNLVVRHNTFHACGSAALLAGGNNAGHDVRNNLFSGGGAAAVEGDAAAFAQLDFNAHHANAGGACTGGCAFGPNSVEAEPGFVDVAKRDLRLRATSPLVDTGTLLGLDVNGPSPGTHEGAAPDPGAAEASP